jgi:acetoacetate decarboxylase
MGFVKTREEIARIESPLSRPQFTAAQMLSVDFLTDPEWVAAVLPPGLEPTDVPRVTAMVGRWKSNCVGDYDGGGVYVAARHGYDEGNYVLAMWMSTDRALIIGRELFGEPKKLGTGMVHRAGDRLTGYCRRDRAPLLELDVTLDGPEGAAETSGIDFNYKARSAANGVGLEDDAVLTLARFDLELTSNREGRGDVLLSGTVHDPLDEIPVGEILRGAYIEGTLTSRCEAVATVPADDFLPYYYGRNDDWSELDTRRWAHAT